MSIYTVSKLLYIKASPMVTMMMSRAEKEDELNV